MRQTTLYIVALVILLSVQEGVSQSSNFDLGLRAYDQENFERAYNYFDLDKSSASLYMMGLSRYQAARYQESSDRLQELLTNFPETRYKSRALDLLKNIELWLNVSQTGLGEAAHQIGVLLPEYDQVRPFTKSLVTGLRLAVDQHNATYPTKSIKIIFRPTGSAQRQMDTVFREYSNLGVDAVVGPLFSEEAMLASTAADRFKIPLMVPLATDDSVSIDRDYVFQINPSYSSRGESMARYATQRLRQKRFGVLYQEGSLAEKMASSFVMTARKQGADVRFITTLKRFGDWYQLDDLIEPDSLTSINSIYIPITGEGAGVASKMAYSTVRRLSPELRIFGNGEWAEAPDETWGDVRKVMYTMASFSDSLTANSNFSSQFEAILGKAPDQPGFAGFNVGSFLSEVIRELESNENFIDEVRSQGAWEGLGRKIDLSKSNANRALYFVELKNSKGPGGQ